MTSIIVGCSGATEIAKKIAKHLKLPYSKLNAEKFPDNELHTGFNSTIKGKDVFLVQSFCKDIADDVLESLFALHTAKDLGAKKVMLVAPYFPYLRQDKRFKQGESINARIIARLFSGFDRVFIVEPHAHRLKDFKAYFPNAQKISAAKAIAEYIHKKFDDYILMGPDEESANWIIPISKLLHTNPIIFEKKRISPRKVRLVSGLSRERKRIAKVVIIVDDIISTGDTMIEAGKEAKKLAKAIYYIGIHGIFVENSLQKLKKSGKVISSNSISSSTSEIDLSKTIADEIRKFSK